MTSATQYDNSITHTRAPQHAEPPMALVKGDRVKFYNWIHAMTVEAVSADFVILTGPRPFKPKDEGERVHTIIQWSIGVRGPDNRLFGFWSENEDTFYDEMLSELVSGNLKLSFRRSVVLDIDWVERDGIKTKSGIYPAAGAQNA